MGRQPAMTGMDDVERQTPHGDTEILDKKTKAATDCRVICILMIFSVALTACIFLPIEYFRDKTHYYVAIDSASGLSPTAEGLSFNLTLGVASRSYGSKACVEPGTYLEVSYHGVHLAASEADVGGLCAGPRKSAEQRVAARAVAVPVHGDVLDSLTADMNQGAAVFDVTLHEGDGESWMWGCKGSRVGADAVWCDEPNQEPTM